jgi:hypothetical protein
MKALYLDVRTGRAGDKPYIESLRAEHIPDSDADASYLEQEGFEDRLAQYRRGDFGFIGIQISAVVAYPVAGGGSVRLETFTSGGLWGIEDDSDRDCLAAVEREELEDLRAHLERFGVDTADFNQIAGIKED